MTQWLKSLAALLAATLATLVSASLAHSHFVQRELLALGIEIPWGARIGAMLRDMLGLAPAFGGIIFVSLLLGFSIATLVVRRWKVPATIAYALAGWAALAVALLAMRLQFTFSPIAGARTLGGFVAISFAGAIGGLVFAWFPRKTR